VKLFLKNKNNFFAKNHREIHVRTILVCALYSINYGTSQDKTVKGLLQSTSVTLKRAALKKKTF
jgi:hypothetical protein